MEHTEKQGKAAHISEGTNIKESEFKGRYVYELFFTKSMPEMEKEAKDTGVEVGDIMLKYAKNKVISRQ